MRFTVLGIGLISPPPHHDICVRCTGSAGRSFGAFLCPGITLRLSGDANHYVAKGLSGGRIILAGPEAAAFAAAENTIVGNVALYGVSAGEAYVYDPERDLSGKLGSPSLHALGWVEPRDRELRRSLLENHKVRTGSALARRLLDIKPQRASSLGYLR